MSSIIANILGDYFIQFGNENQCGSIKQKGYQDANFAVNIALQTLREHGTSVYVIFVDLVKSYDTVYRELLWKILAKCGIPNKVIHVLKKLYNNTTISLKIEQVAHVSNSRDIPGPDRPVSTLRAVGG